MSALAGPVRSERLERALELAAAAVASGEVTEVAIDVRQNRKRLVSTHPRRVFLLASITKPMTAAGIMILADRGRLSIDDPAGKFIPEFTGGGRDRITLRHLLTHTSGLPDMLPENIELRQRHAPLADFVAAAIRTPLLFAPGSEVRYQSMGILLLAEIAERVSGLPLREFLRKELFGPLGMKGTSLGLGGRKIAGTARSQVAEETAWDWNTPYWRDLGAPWGGAHAPAEDVTKFLDLFLYPEGRVLAPDTARSMIAINTAGLREPWGLGWMRKPGLFGKSSSEETFGHYGATGTVAWADPKTKVTCVVLTTKPASHSREGLLGPISDLVAEAVAA